MKNWLYLKFPLLFSETWRRDKYWSPMRRKMTAIRALRVRKFLLAIKKWGEGPRRRLSTSCSTSTSGWTFHSTWWWHLNELLFFWERDSCLNFGFVFLGFRSSILFGCCCLEITFFDQNFHFFWWIFSTFFDQFTINWFRS